MKKSLSIEDYEAAFRPAHRCFRIFPLHEAAISYLGPAREYSTLDLGCGTGELLSLLAVPARQWRRTAGGRSHIYPASSYRRELERLEFSVTTSRAWHGAPRTLRARLLHPFLAPRWFRASLGTS